MIDFFRREKYKNTFSENEDLSYFLYSPNTPYYKELKFGSFKSILTGKSYPSLPHSMNELLIAEEIEMESFAGDFISISPNPTKDILNIFLNVPNDKTIKCRLVSLDGSVQLNDLNNNEENTLSFNVSTLPNGIYVVEIHIDSDIFYRKVVIER